MNLLNKLTIKSLKLNKKRTIVTIIGIMLSVALITAIASVYLSGVSSLTDFLRKRGGNYHAFFKDVPISEVKELEENRNVEAINIIEHVGHAKIDSKNEYKPYASIEAFTKESLENLGIRLIDGKLPNNSNEILIPSHLQTNGRINWKVGDEITLNVGKRVDLFEGEQLHNQQSLIINEHSVEEDIIETTTKTYKIVGIIERPPTMIEPTNAPGYTFITYKDKIEFTQNADIFLRFKLKNEKEFYNYIANILGVNEELFEKSINRENISSMEEQDRIYEEIRKAKYQFGVNTTLIGFEINPIANNSIIGLGNAAVIIMGIVVLASVFCIKNSFDISITEKIKQYGMLRSVGATKKQIKKNVFYEGTILGLFGIPLGLLLGLFASYILILISDHFMKGLLPDYFKLQFSFSYLALIAAIILGIVTIYFSAFRSAKRASKISPIDSIRNSANIKINSKKIKTPKLIKKLFGIGGEISLKNLKRNKKKYRTTIISITISSFVFIALSSFMGMLFKEIKNTYSTTDYNIYFGVASSSRDFYEKIVDTTRFDSVEEATISRSIYVEVEGGHYTKEYIDQFGVASTDDTDIIPATSLGTNQFKKYIKSLGLNYEDVKGKGILIDTISIQGVDGKIRTLREFNFNKDDNINVVVTGDDKKYSLLVGGVTEKLPFGLPKSLDSVIIVEDELLDSLGEARSMNVYYKSNDANRLQIQIEEYLKEEQISVVNTAEQVKMMESFYILIGIFLYGFIIVVSLIGVTSVFNTITTNMELRKQEFAMLKSVGMTKKEFNRMIRLESIFMGLKSLLFSIPIGIALSYLLFSTIARGSSQTYSLPIQGITIAIIVVFMIIFILMKYSINKINKQNIIETIRNENI